MRLTASGRWQTRSSHVLLFWLIFFSFEPHVNRMSVNAAAAAESVRGVGGESHGIDNGSSGNGKEGVLTSEGDSSSGVAGVNGRGVLESGKADQRKRAASYVVTSNRVNDDEPSNAHHTFDCYNHSWFIDSSTDGIDSSTDGVRCDPSKTVTRMQGVSSGFAAMTVTAETANNVECEYVRVRQSSGQSPVASPERGIRHCQTLCRNPSLIGVSLATSLGGEPPSEDVVTMLANKRCFGFAYYDELSKTSELSMNPTQRLDALMHRTPPGATQPTEDDYAPSCFLFYGSVSDEDVIYSPSVRDSVCFFRPPPGSTQSNKCAVAAGPSLAFGAFLGGFVGHTMDSTILKQSRISVVERGDDVAFHVRNDHWLSLIFFFAPTFMIGSFSGVVLDPNDPANADREYDSDFSTTVIVFSAIWFAALVFRVLQYFLKRDYVCESVLPKSDDMTKITTLFYYLCYAVEFTVIYVGNLSFFIFLVVYIIAVTKDK